MSFAIYRQRMHERSEHGDVVDEEHMDATSTSVADGGALRTGSIPHLI